MSYVTVMVGVQWADLPKDDSYPDIPILLGLVDGQELHKIQRHWIFGFDLANDNLPNKILEKIQEEFNVGGCHGWRTAYASPNGGFEVFEYDFDRYELPDADIGQSDAHGTRTDESAFQDEADKRAEDWKD